MKILVASDLHGLMSAYQQFSETLKAGYDVGVIAGDLMDEYIPDEELVRRLNLGPDELLQELPSPADSAAEIVKRWKESEQSQHLRRGLALKEQDIKGILAAAGRPVLVVPGNHDVTDLETGGNFINIHLKKHVLDGVAFVGYGSISRELNADMQMARLNEVEPLIDEETVLVTHFPPMDLLDHDDRNEQGFGSSLLAQAVSRRKPLFHFFGHAHSAAGVNGASINASYPRLYSFFGVDIDTRHVWAEKGRTVMLGERPRPVRVVESTPERKRMNAAARKRFDSYAAIGGDVLASIQPTMDGSDVRIRDDPRLYPLAYGMTHRGELRRFADRMTELHGNDGIVKAIELIDDVNFGLPNEQACLVALSKAARIGRAVYFNLNFMDDIPGILNDTRENPLSIAEMELRHIFQHWDSFANVVTFYRDDAPVPPPWYVANPP